MLVRRDDRRSSSALAGPPRCCSSACARATTRAHKNALTRLHEPRSRRSARSPQQTRRVVLQGRWTAPRRRLAERALPVRSSASRARRDQSLKQAQALSVPGDMTDAQQSLLIALELRRDGLQSDLRRRSQNALGRRGRRRWTRRSAGSPGQNSAFNASDVPVPRARPAVHGRRAGRRPAVGGTSPPSQFLREISWVSPAVRRRPSSARSRLSTGGDDGNDSSRSARTSRPVRACTAPGSTPPRYGDVTSSPTASNRLTYVKGSAVHRLVRQPGRQRRVQHQGHAQDPARQRVRHADHAATRPSRGGQGRGRRLPSSCRSTANRRSARCVNINVTVAAVPGEREDRQQQVDLPDALRSRASLLACVGLRGVRGSLPSPPRPRR